MGELLELSTPLVRERKVRALLSNGEMLNLIYGSYYELLKPEPGGFTRTTLCRGPIANILEWLELRAKVEAKAKGRLQ